MQWNSVEIDVINEQVEDTDAVLENLCVMWSSPFCLALGISGP